MSALRYSEIYGFKDDTFGNQGVRIWTQVSGVYVPALMYMPEGSLCKQGIPWCFRSILWRGAISKDKEHACKSRLYILIIIFENYVYVCACHVYESVHRSQKVVSGAIGLQVQVVISCSVLVLGTVLGFSSKTARQGSYLLSPTSFI